MNIKVFNVITEINESKSLAACDCRCRLDDKRRNTATISVNVDVKTQRNHMYAEEIISGISAYVLVSAIKIVTLKKCLKV